MIRTTTAIQSLFAVCLSVLPAIARAETPTLRYIANEGVLVRSGDKVVLIDALYRAGVHPYLRVEPKLLSDLESAAAPYDDVDIVLVTHHHADHFDANSVAAHLAANPIARLIAPPQVAEPVRRIGGAAIADRIEEIDPQGDEKRSIEHAGIKVEVLRLSHGTGRFQEIQNLGYIVHIGGKRIAHFGDADFNEFTTRPLDAHAAEVDVALIPYWWFMSDKSTNYVDQSLSPARVIMIHIPPDDAKKMTDAAIGREHEIMAFTNPGQEVSLE